MRKIHSNSWTRTAATDSCLRAVKPRTQPSLLEWNFQETPYHPFPPLTRDCCVGNPRLSEVKASVTLASLGSNVGRQEGLRTLGAARGLVTTDLAKLRSSIPGVKLRGAAVCRAWGRQGQVHDNVGRQHAPRHRALQTTITATLTAQAQPSGSPPTLNPRLRHELGEPPTRKSDSHYLFIGCTRISFTLIGYPGVQPSSPREPSRTAAPPA